MPNSLEKLASICGPGLGPQIDESRFEFDPALLPLLRLKNGCYGFESALHIFAWGEDVGETSGAEWNSTGLWRGLYPDLPAGITFFAEDVFGEQFYIGSRGISRFNPETGESEAVADSLDGWAESVLGDHRSATGWPLARGWQQQNGALPVGRRLLPKIPFVANGPFELTNLYSADAIEGMRFRADLARQLRDLPDGATIRFNVVD
ncbi:hypothetical protein [Actinokineospora sp. HUAS TT18]|uniref:hypothetical protein n=1 Tax=Actinokineospora sp. HUAS TT18 TaxID=3447451 RepID=UPI003F5223BC